MLMQLTQLAGIETMLNDALYYENKLTVVYIGAPPPPLVYLPAPPLYIHMRYRECAPPSFIPPTHFQAFAEHPPSRFLTFNVPTMPIKVPNMRDISPTVFASMMPPHNPGCQPTALHGCCLHPIESLLRMRSQGQGVLFRMWGTSPVENQSLPFISPLVLPS